MLQQKCRLEQFCCNSSHPFHPPFPKDDLATGTYLNEVFIATGANSEPGIGAMFTKFLFSTPERDHPRQ